MAAATVQVNVRVAPELYAKIKKRADRDATSVSAIVNHALHNYVTGEHTK